MHAIPKNVKEAATLLDMLIPSWHTKIDTSKLNMGSVKYCILGQLGGFNKLSLQFFGDNFSRDENFCYIFSGCGAEIEWKDEINKRLNVGIDPEAYYAYDGEKSYWCTGLKVLQTWRHDFTGKVYKLVDVTDTVRHQLNQQEVAKLQKEIEALQGKIALLKAPQ